MRTALLVVVLLLRSASVAEDVPTAWLRQQEQQAIVQLQQTRDTAAQLEEKLKATQADVYRLQGLVHGFQVAQTPPPTPTATGTATSTPTGQ